MIHTNRKQILAVSLVAAFLFMAMSPGLVSAQTLPGSYKNGPFVEKLVFNVIQGDDAQVLALQDNDIDMIGEQQIEPAYLDTLLEAENIEVANTFRNGYGYLTINTDKYPFNITDFRRALAFAMDKEAISDDVWEGLSVPQDSCVPQVNPFSIEGQLEYTYYEANVALGNDLLDAAGFVDIDEDGYREAPNGEDFDVLIECSQNSNIAIGCGQIAADALEAMGVNARSEATDFYEYLNRLYFHGDYDIVFLGGGWSTFDVDWLAYEFWSEYADEPYWNFPNWRNTTYDSYRDTLLHSTDYDEVYNAAIEMQRIWVHSCPMVICYENIRLSAYRTDVFEGHLNDVTQGVPCYWTNMKIHKKASEGGPFGGTFRWSNPEDIDTLNWMATTSGYTQNVNQMYLDSLMTIDHQGNDIAWLAESWEIETHEDNSQIPDGYTRITFDMLQNATWSDGTQLTAEDVAFTFNYLVNAPGNQFGSDLIGGGMTAAYAKTPYTFVVEFNTESFWHLHTAGYKPIIPKHVFEEIPAEQWNEWNPDPTDPNEDTFVTSGPFMITEYVPGEFIEMTRNTNWFYGAEWDTQPTTTVTDGSDLTLAIVAGAVGAAVVILVGGYILMRKT